MSAGEYELRAIDGTGALGEYLSDFIDLTFSPVFSDVGSLEFSYPLAGVNYSAISGEEAEVAVTRNGVEIPNGRFLLQDDDGDEVSDDGLQRKFVGRNAVWTWLKDAICYPPNGSVTRIADSTFSAATPGTIIRTLIQRAQTRGTATPLTYASFSNTTDSNGASYTQSMTIAYGTGVNLQQVLQNLVDQGVCEVKTIGRALYLYNPGTLGVQNNVAANPVILQRGRDIKEAPRHRMSTDVANVVLVQGDGSVLVQRTDATSLAARRRREAFVSQGGVSDTGTLSVIGDATLALRADPKVQKTFGLELGDPNSPKPFGDYDLGDWIYVDVLAGDGSTTSLEYYKVRQIVLGLKSSGDTPEIAVTLNDRIMEREIALTRKIQGITGGASAGASNGPVATPPAQPDRLAPAAPGTPGMSSTAYVNNNGVTQAQLTVSWAAVTTNSDGTAIDDLAGYEVQVARVSGQWVPMGRTDSSTTAAYSSGYEPGITLYARVRAYDTNGNVSAWSATASTTAGTDVTPPNTPSTPTVDGSTFLGTLRVTWDGKDSGGAAMPADFAVLEVHASTVNNFTPSIAAGSSTKIDEYQQAIPSVTVFQGNIGAVTYVKFVAVDKVGNRSTASAQGSGTARAGVDADFASISAGKITAGSLVADITVAARIKTANTGARVELNSSGFYAYNSGGTQTVGIDASTGAATFTGTITGSTISGSSFETSHAAGPYMKLDQFQLQMFPGGGTAAYPAMINIQNIDINGAYEGVEITLQGAQGVAGDINGVAAITIYPRLNGSDIGGIYMTGYQGVSIETLNPGAGNAVLKFPDQGYSIFIDNVGSTSPATTRMWIDGPNNGELTVGPRAGANQFGYIRFRATKLNSTQTTTTASAANAYFSAVNGDFARSTSSLKYKEKLRLITEPEWGILKMEPFRYRSKASHDIEDDGKSREFIGLAAEDADMLGFHELVSYDKNGEPDWLMYERIVPLLLPIIKNLKNRLEALEKTA